MKAVAVYLAVYAAALAMLAVFEKVDWTEPLFILVIAGGAFTLVAWLATRGYRALMTVMTAFQLLVGRAKFAGVLPSGR